MLLPNKPIPVPPRELDPAKLQPDPGVFGQWERTGGCNLGCGACCERLYLPIVLPQLPEEDVKDYIAWLWLHGIHVWQTEGRAYATIPLACEALDPETKGCLLHDTPDKPEMCKNWPKKPGGPMMGLEEVCTYKFRRIDEDSDTRTGD